MFVCSGFNYIFISIKFLMDLFLLVFCLLLRFTFISTRIKLTIRVTLMQINLSTLKLSLRLCYLISRRLPGDTRPRSKLRWWYCRLWIFWSWVEGPSLSGCPGWPWIDTSRSADGSDSNMSLVASIRRCKCPRSCCSDHRWTRLALMGFQLKFDVKILVQIWSGENSRCVSGTTIRGGISWSRENHFLCWCRGRIK